MKQSCVLNSVSNVLDNNILVHATCPLCLSGAYHFHTASVVFDILFFSLLILVLSVWHKGIRSVLGGIGDTKYLNCFAMCFEESVILQFLVFT